MRQAWITAAAVAAVVIAVVFRIWPHNPDDVRVYELAARTVLHDYPRPRLYSWANYPGRPFTYPPFAVLPMLPLALGGRALVLSLIRVLLTFALAGLWQISLGAAGRRVRWPMLAVLTVASIALEPVWWDFRTGQISLIVVLLVVVDLVGATPPRYRGVLTGVAAALKLTPLIFVVFLALTRQWRALRLMLGGFAAAALVGFAIFPSASWSYWMRYVHDVNRVGSPWMTADQSVPGTLTRLGLGQHGVAVRLLLLAAVAVTAGAALLVGALWWQRGERLLGVSLTGFASALASPISWAHHWCWIVPLLVALARLSCAAVVLTVVPYCLSLRISQGHWGRWLYEWGAVPNLVGNAYVWAALLVIAYAGWRLRREPARLPRPSQRASVVPTTLTSEVLVRFTRREVSSHSSQPGAGLVGGR